MKENLSLIEILKTRFEEHPQRHPDFCREDISKGLSEGELLPIKKMEETGGEPDLVTYKGELYYVDFSKESPKERRKLCYDKRAFEKRKTSQLPLGNVVDSCRKMGISLLDRDFYLYIQDIEDLDLKTSSRLKTPDDIRKEGGALFGDKRYGKAFLYHNGAESFYSSRGFRGAFKLKK